MRKSSSSRLWAAALGFLAAFGGVGVIVTGLRFHGVEMFTVAAACALAAAVIAVCAPLRGYPAVPGILALACIWLWHRGPLNRSVEALLYQISGLYDLGYGWGILRWSEEPLSTADATLALCLIGILIVLAVTWSVARGRGTWLAATAGFFPLVPCMVLTDTVPSPLYLYLQLLSIIVLLLTHSSRKREARQRNALLKLVALPAALALGLLFLAIPQDSYTGSETAGRIVSFFEDLLKEEDPEDTTQTPSPVFIQKTDVQVNLSAVGVNRALELPVMDVLAEQTGTLYLRGAAYDIYSGTSWDIDDEAVNHPFYCDDTLLCSVTVSTKKLHDVLYMPYVPVALYSGSELLDRYISGRTDNTGKLKEYTVTYHPPLNYSEADSSETDLTLQGTTDNRVQLPGIYGDTIDGDYYTMIIGGANAQVSGSISVPEKYLQLDDDTMAAAQALLAQELPELAQANTPWAKATLITDFVKSSADYDLSTRAMPALEDDFALWFLEESDTGYCIHFATAATVLLRAAEIPARYVTGYLVDAKANETVTVTQANAHAWVECYIPGAGWIILEPTPPDGVDQTAGAQTTVPTENTIPSDTTAPPASSEATGPSVQTTVPENTTAGSEQTLPTQGLDGDTSTIGGADGPTQQRQPLVLPPWLKVLLVLAAITAAVIGQWKLRVMLRRKKWQRGSYNAQALARWQDIVRYARLQETEPDPKLHELALKAKFSQHRLTREELKAFEFALGDYRRAIWNMSRWKRLLATLVYALH